MNGLMEQHVGRNSFDISSHIDHGGKEHKGYCRDMNYSECIPGYETVEELRGARPAAKAVFGGTGQFCIYAPVFSIIIPKGMRYHAAQGTAADTYRTWLRACREYRGSQILFRIVRRTPA